jgi:hypothetical protein
VRSLLPDDTMLRCDGVPRCCVSLMTGFIDAANIDVLPTCARRRCESDCTGTRPRC